MFNYVCFLFLIFFSSYSSTFAQSPSRPNIILIITDDQGYGDFGFTGNPHVKTPVLDQLAAQSVWFDQFYVSPVCAPTRASLMTGRYSLRTGIRDTYNGGAIMASDEVTIAEMLKRADYRTSIFGKWHLGDNYPSRPIDQGFDESLIHLSGGMGQVGDFTTYFQKDSSYFNPVLWHNGQQEKYAGYCSDIFATEAIRFIEDNQDQPFFCYISFNAPHTPLQVPQEYYEKYKDLDPTSRFEHDGRPFPVMNEKSKEDARRVYAMVTNIDDNIGRLQRKLQELNIDDKTILIFMTDNGPQQPRYVAGMRGRKGQVYRGGIRVPLLVKHPNLAPAKISATTAHIDILPTIAELANVSLSKYSAIDGKSLVPLLQAKKEDWPERTLFFYWSRRFPELYNGVALQKGKYKLVGHTDYDSSTSDFELFQVEEDPYEQHNLVREKPALAASMKQALDRVYSELIQSEHLQHQPLIEIGTKLENPVFLNRNDADGERGIWAQEEIFGKWNTRIHAGTYTIRFKFIQPVKGTGVLTLETGNIVHRKKFTKAESDLLVLENVRLPTLEGSVIPFYTIDKKRIFPFWIAFEKMDVD